MSYSKKIKNDTKKLFLTKGTCSQVFFHILNRDFGNNAETEFKAAEFFSGGINQQGYQCGMLWGSSMAVAIEAYKRNKNLSEIIPQIINTTRMLIESFICESQSPDCVDITDTDFTKKGAIAKYFLKGKLFTCFALADRWTAEAIRTAKSGLEIKPNLSVAPKSICTVLLAEKMGADDSHKSLVAGFCGGLGLSGNACGALSTAIFLKMMKLINDENIKTVYNHPVVRDMIEKFIKATDYKFLCSEICGQKFETIEQHSEYITQGTCNKLIDMLANHSLHCEESTIV